MSVPPTSLQGKYDLGADPTWRARCQTGALQAATQVMSEDPSTNGHELRTDFANEVLLRPSLNGPAIAFGVAAQPGVTGADASDSDIQFTINSLWDAWSGVSSSAPTTARASKK
jgi:hypothetical protein